MNRSITRRIVPLAIGLASLAGVAGVGPSPANAADSGLKTRAIQYENASMSDFQAVKRAGPPPFDWRDDGCSVPKSINVVIDNDYLKIFKKACQRHDFGYRNFGKGLRLDRTESRREWVDKKFKADMDGICDAREASDGIDACEFWAEAFFQAVRHQGRDAFFG